MQRSSLLLILPFLPGCLAFGFPSVTYTPKVASLPSDVRAFKSTNSVGGMSIIMTGGEWRHFGVEEIPVENGCLASLDHAYFAYFLGGCPVSFSHAHHWNILLYRPGYEIIELPSRCCVRKVFQPRIDELAWKPAADRDAQLKALDRICPPMYAHLFTAEVREFVEHERERLLGPKRASVKPSQ